ncbi:hypothetical protein [Stackebrandtia soli]|uniref:hypothetical protein n=1 Tax=Stackebrandtia soli TaxID=1892856 RepID=UPI0039EB482E
MVIPWRASVEEFARILRAHGLDPDAVDDVDAAWSAFEAFLQVGVDGIDSVEDLGDGLSVEWGWWSRTDPRASLAFRRLLGVLDTEDRDQPEYWVVELELCFEDSPDWADLHRMESRGTGFEHYELGEERRAALADLRGFLDTYPQLAALFRATPVASRLRLEHV